jgi:hypothetical protein
MQTITTELSMSDVPTDAQWYADYKPADNATVELTEDGEYKCLHTEVEITPPCCSGRDSEGNPSCGCGGGYSVYCYECQNEHMTDNDVENLIGNATEEPDYE